MCGNEIVDLIDIFRSTGSTLTNNGPEDLQTCQLVIDEMLYGEQSYRTPFDERGYRVTATNETCMPLGARELLYPLLFDF